MSCCYSKKLFQKLRIILDASRAVQEVMDIGFDQPEQKQGSGMAKHALQTGLYDERDLYPNLYQHRTVHYLREC